MAIFKKMVRGLESEIKIVMIRAATKALEYKNQNPQSLTDEIIKNIMESLDAKGIAKIGGIASANFAIKYKDQNPNARDKEIMQKIMDESNEILARIKS